MKFGKLIDSFEELLSKYEQGKTVKPARLGKLQQLLADKASRYEAKLAGNLDPEKKSKLEARLKVVQAQLQKSKSLG